MSDAALPQYRIFISSPSDVAAERQRAREVIARLNGEFDDEFHLHTIAWEEETYSAGGDFQDQIEQAAHSDMVIGILWARAGQPLDPARHCRPDGSAYESGTIYEIETALDHLSAHGRPHVVLFRKQGFPPMQLDEAGHEQVRQHGVLDATVERWTNTPASEVRRGLNWFSTADDFEDKVEQHLRQWLDERDHGTLTPVWRTEPGKDGSPFPGLRPYGEKYQRVFFGRHTAVRLCSEALRAATDRGCAFLLIVGSSGAGKSSLAQAGLIPRLAVPGSAPGVNAWRRALMLPGSAPLASLATTLFNTVPALGERGGAADPGSWADRVRRNPAFAASSLAGALKQDERILLLVDQLEEAFIAQSDGFSGALDALARSDYASVIITLRADRYASLQADETLLALKRNGAAYDLAFPGRDEFDDIIRGPARVAGLQFERREEEGKDLGDVLREALRGADALPLLQMTLARLFDARESTGDPSTATLTFEAYKAIGGLEGAISRHADAVLEMLDEATRRELRPLLLELTTAGPDGQYFVRPAPRAALETNPARRALVQRLADARLLVVGWQDELRLAHEALLRNWKAARDILDKEASFIGVRDRLGPLARDWSVEGRKREHLLQPGPLLSDAETVLPQLREASNAETIVAFLENSLAQREQVRRRVRTRLAGDHEKILGYLKAQEFRQAESELDQVIGYLTEENDADLVHRRWEYEARRRRVHQLNTFYTAAKQVYALAGEEDFGKAPGVCEQALQALGVFDDAQWWEHLPIEDLDRDQVEHLKQEVYRQLLLFSALQLVPGLTSLAPRADPGPTRHRSLFDPTRLLRFVPSSVLAAIISAGGLGPYRLPGKQDNPQALAEFRKSSVVLHRVREVEEKRAAEEGKVWRPSRTSQLVGQIVEVLQEFVSGPKGGTIDYRRLLHSPAADADHEPVNAADYFFIGLFNYFVAKRSEGFLAKVVALLQPRFPDLDARSPYATAERLLRAAISLEPNNYWPHWVLGRTLLSSGDYAGAELAFNAAVALAPTYARSYEQRALAVGHQWVKVHDEKLHQRAQDDSERAMKNAEGDPSVFWPRGELFALFGQTKEALEAYAHWLELESNLLQTIARGTGVASLYDLAHRILRHTGSVDPSDRAMRADAYGLLALVHLTWTDHQNARQAAEEALRIDPCHVHALTVKGVVLRESSEFHRAIEVLTLALEQNSLNYLAALNRARAYEQITANQKALEAWRDLLARAAQAQAANAAVPGCPPWMLLEARTAEKRILENLQP
jgi:Tfp pilus assembly protein PilF